MCNPLYLFTLNKASTKRLTTSDDNITGTSGNDLITATSATLSADDSITDSSTTDSDVLNITATKAVPALDVLNIESINIDWDSFVTPTIDLDNVQGATVTISSNKVGYQGNVNVDNVGSNDLVFGSGITGDVTADSMEDASLVADSAESLTMATADNALDISVASADTVTIADGQSIELNAPAASTISITGGDYEVANLTLGVDVELTYTGASDAVLNLESAEDITVTLVAASELETIAATGAGAITLEVEDLTDLNESVVTGIDDVVISEADFTDTTLDLSEVAVSTITFETDANAAAIAYTVRSGLAVVMETDATAPGAVTFQSNEDADTAADTISLTFEVGQGTSAYVFDTPDQEIEVVNITIDSTDSLTIFGLEGNSDAGTELVFTSDDADVDVTVTDLDAAQVTATAIVGGFTMAQTSNEDLVVLGAEGDNDVTFASTDAAATFIGQDGDDAVTLATTSGSAAIQSGDGDDSVTSGGALTGDLNFIAGDGDDTLTLDTDPGDATVAFLGGDGTDEVVFSAAQTDLTDEDFAGFTSVEVISLFNAANSITLGTIAEAAGIVEVNGGNNVDIIDLSDMTVDMTVRGDAGADVITGGAGDDAIFGGAGADVITGGAGEDLIALGGGSDSDQVIFSASSHFGDTVVGFTSNDVVTIDIGGASAAIGGTVFSTLFTSESTATTAAGAFMILGGTTGSATLATVGITGAGINIFGSTVAFASAAAFTAAINSLAFTGVSFGTLTSANILVFGAGTGGTLWAAIITAGEYARTGVANAATVTINTDAVTVGELVTIGTIPGVLDGALNLV